MNCDICKTELKYKDYIYRQPEMIYFCLDCASEHIKDEQVKNDETKNWIFSKYNK